jgi:hypothetical protein
MARVDIERLFDIIGRPNRTPVRVPDRRIAAEESSVALIHIPPVEARVTWDRSADRPSAVAWKGGTLRVANLDVVRDERSAYPAGRGPRITYLLRATDGGRASVVFDGMRRRWFVEAIEQAA